MSNETGKAYERRKREGYFDRYLVGKGIDIGCGPDPVTPDCLAWDRPQGDAQTLDGLEPESFDWVYSSHCLEHLKDPYAAIHRWWEILKFGGYMLVVVPDEDLFEQGIWPSKFNPWHETSYTIHKSKSWSPASINLTEMVAQLPNHQVHWIRLIDDKYDYSGGVWDRTRGEAEAHIELLVRKVV